MRKLRKKPTPKAAIGTLSAGEAGYPPNLAEIARPQPFSTLRFIGNLDLLGRSTLGLVCSAKIPGTIILQTYEFAKRVPHSGPVIVGGFHSPMERQCLEVFLARKIPVVFCPAREIASPRLAGQVRDAVAEGRMLIISPFGPGKKRATRELARVRNEFVAALADRVLIPCAMPGSATEQLVGKVAAWGKPILLFDHEENSALKTMGAITVR